jgi:hypothetical protein
LRYRLTGSPHKNDQGAEGQDWLTEENIASALGVVAHRLGKDSVSFHEYDEERKKILRGDHARWLHGRKILLPTARQVRYAVANKTERESGKKRRTRKEAVSQVSAWNAALEMAGLAPTKGAGHFHEAVDVREILDRCYEAHGTEPRSHELVAFAKANGISYNSHYLPGRYRDWVRAWKEERIARGLDVPERPPPPDQRPDYSKDVGAGRPGEERRPTKSQWRDVQSCVDYVIVYLEQLRSPQRPTVDHYLRWAQSHEGAPSPRLFDKHGGWAHVRSLAYEQILRERRRPGKTRAQTKKLTTQTPKTKKTGRKQPASKKKPTTIASAVYSPETIVAATLRPRRKKPRNTGRRRHVQ